ncbi:hypothetical protein [Blastopirellula marina]|uniref:Uncharacterized protein n=1 Tax=Blastopirellula marina DSM 3645 TaxID=314230 RepID=A3ZZD0_9BACT|nr:hypothetical protein [Blastopirellula marina]EAQ78093.1 hypothetical protein DSM3645_18771 [Blastopirellula marina DSM 3645]
MKSIRLFWLLTFLVTWSTAPKTPCLKGAEPPHIQDIVAAGRQTQERLATDTAAWTTVLELPNDLFAEVDTVRAADMEKQVIRLTKGDSRLEIAEIISREGLWYVTTKEGNFKYRPFEAPLSFPAAYFFLARSEIRMIVDEIDEAVNFAGVADNVATYRMPLPEANAQQIKSALKMIKDAETRSPDSVNQKMRDTKQMLEGTLNTGIEVKLDITNGVILKDGVFKKQVWFKNFRWVPASEDSQFDISQQQWTDRTQPLANQESLRDLITIANQPLWRPGTPDGDMNLLLLNIRTGDFRRLPYQHGVALGGCFSKDRSRVYLAGNLPLEGSMCLFEIDLLSGENIRIGGPELQSGMVLSCVLSPDDRYLAVLKQATGKGPLDFQIYIHDLETGETRPLGETMDTGFPSWLPDGKGIVLVTREYAALDKPSINTVCRMDLSGKITSLLQGSSPVMLMSESRIMYENNETDLWYSCDLDGKDVQMIGDGLKGYGFPTASPDGNQVIMMKFGGAEGPRPYLVEISSGQATPIPAGPGLWAYPAWR